MSPGDAAVVARWRYPALYALYDGPARRESESVAYMLDPENGFHAVRGPLGLVGFCSFGIDGRVPGGTYDDDALDIGAGMAPALVGKGHGAAFLGAVVEYGEGALNALRLRVTVASWNERALRAFSSVGFRSIGTFRTEQGMEFTILLRETSGVAVSPARHRL